MRALQRKLLRDLWNIRSQALAISLVVASGVALLVMSLGCFGSLTSTRDSYYNRFAFAHVFAGAKRVPEWVEERIASIRGVTRAMTRVVVDVTLDVAEMDEPVRGRLISLPDSGEEPALNALYLRSGRWIDPDRDGEALVDERFAEAHGLEAGDTVTAVINGRRQEIEVTGIALTPEYVYTISGGEIFPDPRRFGIFWVARKPLATAFEMEGGFNDVSLLLAKGASERAVISRLDQLLEPYGGFGAIGRAEQISNWYLENELQGLQSMAFIIPMIFLGVATFLLNLVLRRIVAVQREQIAALKALGYSNRSIGLHYTQWAVAVTFLGAAIGLVAGTLLSRGMLGIYMEYFRFPLLEYQWSVASLLGAIGVSLAASALGALGAVRTAVTLPPAEAMRPAAPTRFRVSLVERLGLRRFLSQPARMIVRNLARRPIRALASITGIAFAAAIMVVGVAMVASMEELLEVQFNIAQRQDVTVSFFEPAEGRAIHEVASLPGVLQLEPMRVVPARLRYGHRSKQVAIQGLETSPSLQRIIGADYRPVDLPRQGLVLSATLGEILGAQVGDTVEIEVLEGTRPHRRAVVAELVDDFLGTSAYMEIEALQRMARQGETLSGAVMKVDSMELDRLYERLKDMPAVAGVGLRRAQLENFQTYMGENMGMLTAANLFFALVIAFGVIYNTARISLSETSRELASLRVIGFTRREISAILLGELTVLTVAAIPLGLVLGYGMVLAAMRSFESELFRIPIVLTGDTFVMATVTVVVSMVLSAAVVRRRLYNLDLIGVLKIRE